MMFKSNKTIQLIFLGLMAVSFTTPLAGCGARQVTQLPDPVDPNAPKLIGNMVVTVIDNTSKPLADCDVSIKDASGKAVGDDQTTGPDGKATFAKVPTGSGYTVTAEDNGVTASQAGLGIDNDQPLVVTVMLVPGDGAKGSIGGTLTDGLSGAPLDGATVSILGTQNTIHTAADGSFLLKDVPAGNPTVVASEPGYREARTSVALRGGKLERADLKLFPSGDAARLGHTVISNVKTILEVDKFSNTVWTAKKGAYQAHPLDNGDLLVTGGAGIAELTSNHMTAWSYNPVIFGRLSDPQGVSKTKSGNVLIADTNNNRILEVTPNHNVQTTLKARLNHPSYAERVESAQTTLIADTGSNRVVEINAAGQIVWGVGDGSTSLVNHPTYATRLGNGNTLITDTGNSRVMEVNKQQQLVWMYGGKGDGSVCRLPNSAVRLANGNTLISDTGNNRVIEVNNGGDIVWQVPVEQPLFAERI